ncbi:MAG: hypothetical protein AAGJ53_02540 [Pseudomonadota bacterium]
MPRGKGVECAAFGGLFPVRLAQSTRGVQFGCPKFRTKEDL